MEAKASLSSSSSTLLKLPLIQQKPFLSFKTNFINSSQSNISIKTKPLSSMNNIKNSLTNSPIIIAQTNNNNSDYNNKNPHIKRKKLAVFVSGGGSNFISIHQACIQNLVFADIVALVTNKPSCGGADYALDNGIPVIVFPETKVQPNGLSTTDLVSALGELDVDFILLAGYLKLIPAELVRAYPRRIFNIHPSLLPAFGGKGCYGINVHKAVIASGARYSGPTIHFVDEHYDTGRILAQRVVPVLANDTPEELAARVLKEEHRLYVDVTIALCEERIIWREDGVPLIQSRENPEEFS